MVLLKRQPGNAAEADLFQKSLSAIQKQPVIFICHLRKASPGIAITPNNIHPFFYKNWGFVHNGTLFQPESLPRDTAFKLTSDGSDSEHFFHYLLSHLSQKIDHRERGQVIANAISRIKVDYTALNCLFSDGEELFAVRKYKYHPEYYTLYTYQLPKGLLISSEPINVNGLDPAHWKLIENNSVLKISGDSPRIEKYQIR
jgi:glutamine amidotransferase